MQSVAKEKTTNYRTFSKATAKWTFVFIFVFTFQYFIYIHRHLFSLFAKQI